MNKDKAILLTDNYFKAWLTKDFKLFSSVLHQDIIVKECIGDIYNSKEVAEKWFKSFNINNSVLKWDIYEYLYDFENETLIPLWVFRLSYEGNEFGFKGTSIIRFKDELIHSIDEYQMEIKE